MRITHGLSYPQGQLSPAGGDARIHATKLIDTSIRAQLDDPRRGYTEHVGLASGSLLRRACEFGKCRVGGVMSDTEKKAEVGTTTSVGDLDRVVKVRKYQHCQAEYAKLAMEPNTMPEVRDRYQDRTVL
jgi:hypothetical protein